LGEAGTIYSREFAAHGATVRGFDIRNVGAARDGVTVTTSAADAVAGADLILSLTTAEGALEAATATRPHLAEYAVYADLNAASPADKAAVALTLEGTLFADVAVLAPVSRNGLSTPALVAGTGARRFAELLAPFGADLDVMDAPAGTAASRKLLRSVFMKALAATILEALTAGRAAESEDWVRAQIVNELDSGGSALVDRLVTGTYKHARRRLREMEDTRDYLTELAVPDDLTTATITWLRALVAGQR
jgi:3-hydroxyisobutyrate dehydrogenase-like beta-hydroxyacid dehydrogenase